MKSIESIIEPSKDQIRTFESPGLPEEEVNSRQNMLLGKENVEIYSQLTVGLVGAGTGNNPVMENVAEKGCNLWVCDSDVVTLSNLAHQGFTEQDLGKEKAIQMAKKATNRASKHMKAIGIPMSFEEAAASQVGWLEKADVVVVFTDNFASRFEVAYHYYGRKPVLIAGIESSNTLAWLFVQEAGGPCIRCCFPDITIESPDPTSCSGMSLDPARALDGYISFAIDSLFLDHKYRRRNWNWLKISLDGFLSDEKLIIEQDPDCEFCS